MSTSNYVQLENLGFATVTAAQSGAAVGLTASYPVTAVTARGGGRPGTPNFAYISCDGTSARWRDDGTAPTATVGMPLPINTLLAYDGELGKIQFIGSGAAGSASSVYVSFYNSY